uniref:fibronectin type III domain-containing protein n=1 Tax=Deinococcus sp. TaxID=47478 RepID=UPI002869A7CF
MTHRFSIRSASPALTALATAALLGGCGGSGGTSPLPPVPAGLQVTGTTASSVTLTWTSTANATGYTLERRTGSSTAYVPVAPPVGTATTYTDTGLTSS